MKGKARVGGMLWNLETDRWKILGSRAFLLLTPVRECHQFLI